MTSPLELYQQQIASGEILEDPQQRIAIQKFEALYQHLTHAVQKPSFLSLFKKKPKTFGIYIWGDVGIGKTFLVDTFFYCLPFDQKLRIHFYQFMRKVHADLHELKDTPNPLTYIAKQWAQKARVICFDELLVNDIADAMLLSELLRALMKQGVYLIFTSNRAPDDLYKNGLQRQRFIPAIEAIKQHLEIIHLSTQDDYRTQNLHAERYYWYPLTLENQRRMTHSFEVLSQHAPISTDPIKICDREIPVKALASKVIWFEFKTICSVPRSSQDYLALSEIFETVFVSNVTVMNEKEDDVVRLFIQLIDVLYDAGIKLVMSGAVPVDELYVKGRFLFEFERTKSRLKEMLNNMVPF